MLIGYNEIGNLVIQKRENKSNERKWFDIGTVSADLNKRVIKDHKMKSALIRIGKSLMKQCKCDGVKIIRLEFQRINFRKEANK